MMDDDVSLVEVNHITRRFRRVTAIRDVSFAVQQGDLFGILGPDGAGKTTLLRMLAAVLNPSEGHITIDGYDTMKDAEAIKAQIGYMPQRFGLYGDLSVEENLAFVADVFAVKGEQRQRRMDDLYKFTQLENFKIRHVRNLSGGMKKKLGLACALIHEPPVLLLDEPTIGVDPVARRGFWDLLSRLHGQGTTTVVSTPYMDEAERCNRVALLFEGQILACDTPRNIKAMVPGQVIALEVNDLRAAQQVLASIPGILNMQTYGNRLNLIVQDDDLEAFQQHIHRQLTENLLEVARIERTVLRMEEAFIYFVNQARQKQLA